MHVFQPVSMAEKKSFFSSLNFWCFASNATYIFFLQAPPLYCVNLTFCQTTRSALKEEET